MEIPQQLMSDIEAYCKLNNIPDTNKFVVKMLRQGFTAEKYGSTPIAKTIEAPIETTIEKEVVEPIITKQKNKDLYGE